MKQFQKQDKKEEEGRSGDLKRGGVNGGRVKTPRVRGMAGMKMKQFLKSSDFWRMRCFWVVLGMVRPGSLVWRRVFAAGTAARPPRLQHVK
ncbi:MAG: hypothetical protein WC205_09340 [Opitutaceae bacterium]|jgi:hypothetical protein